MRRTLTDKGVNNLRPRPKGYAFPDPQMVGHYIRIRPSGSKSFVVVARDPYGKQIWHTIGNCDALRIEESRELARAARKRIKDGNPPVDPPPVKPDTLKDVAENWFARVVMVKKFRTEPEIRRCLERYIYPRLADRDFVSIRRSDISSLLDHIEDHHGSRMADVVLGHVRNIATWFAGRNDDYVSPFTARNLRRYVHPARSRILDDTELKAVWKQAEVAGKFGSFLQLLLLTAQRSAKVVSMRWSDIDENGVWTIPSSEREKNTIGSVALPQMALDIIRQQPRVGKNPFIFAGRGNGCMDISKSKYQFDAALDIEPWVIHDLRKTSRSLLSRCGVSYEIGERILGHSVGSSVSQIYDRYKFADEKKAALAKLATLIDGILHERANVVPIQKRGNRP
jgi:integrase